MKPTIRRTPRNTPRSSVAVLRRKGRPDMAIPREYIEQRKLFSILKSHARAYPDLLKMFAVPNGGSRGNPADKNNREGLNLKLEGVVPGVPDTCLPVPRLGYHGLYIEMKRVAFGMGVKWGSFGEGQVERLRELREDGYCAMIGIGHEHAVAIALAYICGDREKLVHLDTLEELVAVFQQSAPKSLAVHLR